MNIPTLLWVALGGSLGALSRFGLSSMLHRILGKEFPLGTLAVNLLGCFAIGFVYHMLVEQNWGQAQHRHLLLTGFLGAFTTFSTFSLESIHLLQASRYLAAFGYLSLSLIGGLAFVLLGIGLAKLLA